jgi:hypothetical protein
MSTDQSLSPLVERLRAWGLNGLAAAVLEQAGPLAFLGAQALYVSAPALRLVAPGDTIMAMARLLEDPEAVRGLAQQLSEEG